MITVLLRVYSDFRPSITRQTVKQDIVAGPRKADDHVEGASGGVNEEGQYTALSEMSQMLEGLGHMFGEQECC